MRYALVEITEGESRGFNPKYHRTTPDGMMVLNENELMEVDDNPAEGARCMRAHLVSEKEMYNILNKKKS